MYEERLPTDLWVRAHLRRCSVEGIPATVARKGEPRGGTVLLKLNLLDAGCRVLTQLRDLDGRRGVGVQGPKDPRFHHACQSHREHQ